MERRKRMSNKEQIARKYVQCTCDEIFTSRNLTAPDCPYHSSDVESAMDEYAELQCVEFGAWIYTYGYRHSYVNANWYHLADSSTTFTTKELYKLFLQSQQPNT